MMQTACVGPCIAAAGSFLASFFSATTSPSRNAGSATASARQAAIKARDGERTWELLDKASQESAERTAKALRANYDKASADDKVKQEKALGLKADEMAKLTGKLFLQSKRFHGKYHEVPG